MKVGMYERLHHISSRGRQEQHWKTQTSILQGFHRRNVDLRVKLTSSFRFMLPASLSSWYNKESFYIVSLFLCLNVWKEDFKILFYQVIGSVCMFNCPAARFACLLLAAQTERINTLMWPRHLRCIDKNTHRLDGQLPSYFPEKTTSQFSWCPLLLSLCFHCCLVTSSFLQEHITDSLFQFPSLTLTQHTQRDSHTDMEIIIVLVDVILIFSYHLSTQMCFKQMRQGALHRMFGEEWVCSKKNVKAFK